MKFFLAVILVIFGKLKRQLGKEMKELCEMSTVSSSVHLEISSGSVDILLCDKFNSAKNTRHYWSANDVSRNHCYFTCDQIEIVWELWWNLCDDI